MVLKNADGSSTFLIKGSPVFSNGPRSLPRNPPDFSILWNWVFNIFILTDEPFARVLASYETCVLLNNNLCGKLFSSLESPKTFDESFEVTSLPFLIPDFNLLSWEFDNFMFKMLYWVVLYWYYVKVK